MSDAATSTIEVRRPAFEWPDDLALQPVPDDPAASAELLAISFTLPYLEPYLIRTMRSAAKLVVDPRLRADMKAFSGQEAQHYQQHARINDLVRVQFSPETAAAMRSLEDALETDYRRFTKEKSDRFNLAYAEGFEAMTFSLARALLASDESNHADPSWRQLILWHLAEEIEHRTVTFDAFDQTYGNWPYRSAVGSWAQAHFLRYVVAMATVARRDLLPGEASTPRAAWYSLRRHVRLGTVGGMVKALSPKYDPRRVTLLDPVLDHAEIAGVDLR